MTKTKLSYFAAKALLGGSLALIGVQLNDAEITIRNQEDFKQHFTLSSDGETWKYNGHQENTTITFPPPNAELESFFGKVNQNIWIPQENETLTLKSTADRDSTTNRVCQTRGTGIECWVGVHIINLDTGSDYKEGTLAKGTTKVQELGLEVYRPQRITANLQLTESEVIMWGDNARLAVGGNLDITNSHIIFQEGGYINANGSASITDSGFYILKNSFAALEANNIPIIEAKSFSGNVTNNYITAAKPISFKDYISDSNLKNEVYAGAKTSKSDGALDLKAINGKSLVD